MDFEIARQQMIGQQLRAWDVLDERVLDVMAALPRELFVPTEWRQLAYADAAIPLGHGRRLAPPKIQGRALQALLPRADETVLEIGGGTGYLTACLARLAGHVKSVEIERGLATAARRNLAQLGIENAEVLEGDPLAMEFPSGFDVICVNGSLPSVPDELKNLLTTGGRLFVVTGRAPLMHATRVLRRGKREWVQEDVFETCLPPLENAPQAVEFTF